MPEASGILNRLKKPLLTAVAIAAATAGWGMAEAFDPPRATALGMMGIGAVGILFFTLRPRPRHPHSSLPLPLFPVLVLA
jgi:hypothetical protein